uniref:Metalloendopeptidase n=1 Tax=Glossina brevipalpis TaxID=37001 RepID=A0A1A9X2F0_9MUSC
MMKLFLLALFAIFSELEALPLLSDTDDNIVEIESNYLEETENSKDLIDFGFLGPNIYGLPDEKTTGQLVANYSATEFNVNPEELGSYLEGDILIPRDKVVNKNGVATPSSRWLNAIVPFEIRGNFNAREMPLIEHAFEQFHRYTCIRFVPRTGQHNDYISIVNGNSGCWSTVGRIGGRQEVNLQSPGCLTKSGTAIHELMHVLGFLHEQNRQERDDYVAIQYHNIEKHAVGNFDRAPQTVAFGIPYDYGSVMHYSPNAFSSNGRPTIVPLRPLGDNVMGQRDGLSAYDIEKLNNMYDCARRPAGPVYGPDTGSNGIENGIVNSFLGGFLTGLGLAEEEEKEA